MQSKSIFHPQPITSNVVDQTMEVHPNLLSLNSPSKLYCTFYWVASNTPPYSKHLYTKLFSMILVLPNRQDFCHDVCSLMINATIYWLDCFFCDQYANKVICYHSKWQYPHLVFPSSLQVTSTYTKPSKMPKWPRHIQPQY